MEPLPKYMEEKGDRNLIKLLHVSPTFSWKSAPDITFLSEHAPLFQRYAKIAPNSMSPLKKNKTAIERGPTNEVQLLETKYFRLCRPG